MDVERAFFNCNRGRKKWNWPVPRRLTGFGSTGFSLWVFARPEMKTHRLKPVLLIRSDVVEAFDAEHAGDFANIGGDAFELLAVGDFQREVDAGVQIIGMAAEGANVRAGLRDCPGDG